MKLNRYNYEEYFILYVDNELSSEDRREVELFIQQNTDLKAEMDMLLQSKLAPETDISFSDKESLLRFGNVTVNMKNYEEWLLSYIDDELTSEERKQVERFIANNSTVQQELNLLEKAKLQPEVIVFPNKESLYFRTEKSRVISITWRRIAVAAVLLIGITTTAIVLLNNKSGNGEVGIVEGRKNEIPINIKATDDIKTSPVQQSQNINTENKEELADNTRKKNEPIGKEVKKVYPSKVENDFAKKDKNILPIEEKKEEPFIVRINPDNDLPKPDNNPNVIRNEPPKEIVAEANIPKEILTDPNKKTEIGAVTVARLEPSDLPEQSGKSNKGLRGFLRKVTRTFEKRTNIKATDDDDRLLIAGLAIKM